MKKIPSFQAPPGKALSRRPCLLDVRARQTSVMEISILWKETRSSAQPKRQQTHSLPILNCGLQKIIRKRAALGSCMRGNVVRKKRADRCNPSCNHAGIDFKGNRQRDGLRLGEKLANGATVMVRSAALRRKNIVMPRITVNPCIFLRACRLMANIRRYKQCMRLPALVSHAGQGVQSVPRHGNRRKQGQHDPDSAFLCGSFCHCAWKN